MMQPTPTMSPGMSPGMSAAPQGGANTVTIDMTPGAITVSSAAGTKQCGSIGECLQAVLEMYEGMAGGEGGEGDDSAFQAGYGGDQSQMEQRPVRGGAVK